MDGPQSTERLDRFDAILRALPAEEKNNHLESALTAVLKGGSTKLFESIMSVQDLNLNIPDRHGWTALDIASSSPTLSSQFEVLEKKGAIRGSAMKEATKLDSFDLPYNFSLSPDCRDAWMEALNYNSHFTFMACIRADHCIPPKSDNYFEVEILEHEPGNAISVGLVQESLDLASLVGLPDRTWGYHSDDGSILSGDKSVIDGAPRYKSGDTVGMFVNMARRLACFTLNNTWRSAAFEIYGQVYPAVSFILAESGVSKVRINFGPEKGGKEFKYKLGNDWAEIVAVKDLPPLEKIVG